MNKTTFKNKKVILTISLLWLTFFATAQTQTQTYTSTGTFTVPAGVNSITVEAWGGGGRGSSSSVILGLGGGGGGGGGAYAKKVITVTPGVTYSVNVGAGSSSTAAGGDSWVVDNATILAKGGNSVADNNATGATGGLSSACIGSVVFSGGNGKDGGLILVTNFSGGGGSSAGTAANGNNATNQNGAVAPAGGGNGGNGTTSGGNGSDGSAPGGGGGGGNKLSGGTKNGGSGGNGQVIITYGLPEINIQGNAVTITDGDTSPTTADWSDFGSTTVGVGTTQTYTIYNTGTSASLIIGGITFSGTNATEFSVTTAPASTVLPGGSTTFTVTFSPLATGTRTAAISIVNNDTNENPYNFSIQGTSIGPEINIQGNATSIVDGDTTPSTADWTDFGTASISIGVTKTFTIQNAGPGVLSVGTISVSGTNSTDFAVTTPPAATVVSGGSTTFVVTFNPSGFGTRTAAISIVNNDSNENPYNFSLQGNGIYLGPEINIQGNSTTIVNGDVTPDIIDGTDFGATQMISDPVTKTFTIYNLGSTNVNLTGSPFVSITGSSDFSVVSFPVTPVTSLSSTTFSVKFNPSSLGSKTATITIANNDTDENPYTFQVQGMGAQTFFDSDKDGVYDNVDIDDDNDGIIDVSEEMNCRNSNGHSVNYKFLNETFGTGSRTTINTTYDAITTYCYEDGIVGANTTDCPFQSTKILDDGEYCVVSKITGTIASDPENIHGDLAWYNGEDHTTGDSNGRMAVFNASFTPGIFYETTITGVLSNLPITYSFWALNIMAASTFPGSILPNITVQFVDLSNNILATYNTGNIGRCSGSTSDNTCSQGVWKQFATSVNLGNVNTFTIRFINNAPGGGGNDIALDDILISQTLCDLDGDGIADLYDLDADNDGIEDIIEAGLGPLSNGKGKMDVAWADANVNGLHDSAESNPLLDSDGDGIYNYIDLDSDNDTLFDVDESNAGNSNAVSGFVNGDGDINGDGTGDGPESETFRSKDINGDTTLEGFGDGILDIYDYGTGTLFNDQYGNLSQGTENLLHPAATYLLDSDNDGIPDYIDITSNGATYDIALTLYASLDANNDGRIDSPGDIDKDGITDTFDTNTAYFGSPRDLDRKLYLNFDGRNDYGQGSTVLGGLASASLMGWIDLNSSFSTEGVVIGQDKFQLRITSGKKLEAVVNGTTLTYNTVLNTSQWYHVGAVYGGGYLKLYLNGNLVMTQAASGNIGADTSLLTIGRNPSSSNKFFKGKIDEIRVFNVALTDSQLQRMVYQEIQNFSSQVRGAIVPKDVGLLPYSNLLRYYRMDAYKDDIIDDLTTAGIDTVTGMEIYNHKNIYVQQAPMPFITEQTGNFATAVNSPSKDIRGMDIMDQDWSIVQVKHNITETSNNIDLGMFVDSGVDIIMNNDTKIQNDWYLKLDGKVDLVGKSQLVQTTESDLDVTSSGFIERDQKGQSNKYNYNYWSSPVGSLSTTSNNNSYTVAGMMKDGTDPNNIQSISWTSGYDGSATSPITLSSYWIFKFQNVTPLYANWASVGPNGLLMASQGYTLKGSNAGTATQNYTFVGKPNSGTITTPIAANNLNLSGNPYPSAIDATAFINANITSTNGTLYFWEHYNTNYTHNLAEYQGGYATRNLVGGVPPVAPVGVSGLGSSTRIPGRYIPVGQGFFVKGNATGGNIVFNNSLRGFVKEDHVDSNVMFKQSPIIVTDMSNNEDDFIEDDSFAKIRLGFTSFNGYHRQVLLAFMDENATSGFDIGYDAINIENLSSDLYFINNEKKLIIQGDGFFDSSYIYPIGVKCGGDGTVRFVLDAVENFNNHKKIYIYDNITHTYNSIRNQAFEIYLPAGTYNDRFSLRFKITPAPSSGKETNNEVADFDLNDSIVIDFTNNDHIINVKNSEIDTTVKSVTLFNLLGQTVSSWDVTNENQTNIQLPVKKLSFGTYIIKVQTTNGDISKKVIIN